jgi:hypothetical protein
LLSYDSHPAITELYGGAHIKEISLNYSINGAVTKSEYLISNMPFGISNMPFGPVGVGPSGDGGRGDRVLLN